MQLRRTTAAACLIYNVGQIGPSPAMDRPIEQKTWTHPRTLAIAAAAVVGIVLVVMLATSRTSSLNVASGGRLTVSQVRTGEFQEYVPITGSVQPQTTVFLDLEEGGIVEKVFVEGGTQ